MSGKFNPAEVKTRIKTKAGEAVLFSLPKLEKMGFGSINKLPYSIKVLLENAMRNYESGRTNEKDIERLAQWSPKSSESTEIAFMPGRVILQDFTGVPCVVDLAAMRSAMKRMGGDYRKINPQVPCDLIIDHSVQTDFFGSTDALGKNVTKEFERNQERYEFLKWGQQTFKNFRVIPPATGIVHQVNLEYIAKGVLTKKCGPDIVAYPDSLIGTDSHTTMINGLGILGWGVGGIEAEAVMLGEPIYMLMPQVIGFKLTGKLKWNVTATDLVLTATEMLRKKGVVGKFVEFYGDGLNTLSLPDRATISNMCPEYGATVGIFPVDEETLRYYRMTGRTEEEVDLIERYMIEQGMFYSAIKSDVEYTDILELDLENVETSLAGPKRPYDRISIADMKSGFDSSLTASLKDRGFALSIDELNRTVVIKDKEGTKVTHGAVAIASITSCTNTSNPSVLIGAGLLAKKAVEKGLGVKDYVKTSFAPGSKVVSEYLNAAGFTPYLEKLGFHIVGYGCMTCIGNSGPLPEKVAGAINEGNIVVASVLSGNRNFEGRINPLTKANYLASPLLVVAYALAGTVAIDLTSEPIGKGNDGNDVYLKDIWPTQREINQAITSSLTAGMFKKCYSDATKGSEDWNRIKDVKSDLYKWNADSTYIQEPPFFETVKMTPDPIQEIKDVRVLVMVGDSITTDHISPAGVIAEDAPAGIYLRELGIKPADFNSYGSRRGNDRVMTRGTFANIRLRNLLTPKKEGSSTICFLENKETDIFAAAQMYKKTATPLLVLAGTEYGIGSSRDWAAKGTALLGIKVVLAESFERIHRSNLVGMGVLPLQFKDGESRESLGLNGDEVFDFLGLSDNVKPQGDIVVCARSKDGAEKEFSATLRLDTQVDIDYYRNGGILQFVLRKLLQK